MATGRRRVLLLAGTLLAGVVVLLWHVRRSDEPIDFNRDVRPILNEQCVVCHGGVRRNADLSLLFREDALAPAESGNPAIVPGHPGRSELIRRIRHHDPEERMPLDAPPLSDQDVAVLRKWIEQGAPWEPHWAYVPPRAADLPEVSMPEWVRNGIDGFVLARLDAEGLAPSPRADCAVLLRRVSLDLVGLPPSPDDVDRFCQDPTPEAYAEAVERLLASPHFGERWASLWLDLARYADSNGFEKDEPRVIWRYRDWVIQAFNDDMPFDRFTIEQLAGDLLPDPTVDQLIATAFHRNTMTNTEGGTDDEEFRIAAVIDRVNTTFEAWQGTTIACVQCHGHPYDPFRYEEFYRLMAFFNNTADADRSDNEPKLVEFDEPHQVEGARLLAQLEAIEREIESAVEEAALEEWTARLEVYASDGGRPPTFDERTVPVDVLRIARLGDAHRSPNQRARLREFFVAVRPEFEDLRRRRSETRQAMSGLEPVTTPVMRELPPETSRRTHVFDVGNWLVTTEEVEPDMPRSLPPLSDDLPRNRLGLALWLVSPENPLTARVTVNRFWEQLFGYGLVETLEDFGTQGEAPSHPELLDWLALRFMQEMEWSVKRLLEEIVTSATYQQTSRVSPDLLRVDPRNVLLARGPRFRLTGEQVRDQALAVSGLLSDKMYGPSVFPPQPPGLWANPYSPLEWETSEGEDRYRRAVYTFWRRTVPYPALLAFDAMTRELCTSRRIRTNTPIQSLVTLNDPAFVEAAVALAGRMQEEGGASVEARIRHGFRLALLRDPDSEVVGTLRRLYDAALAEYRDRPFDAHALLDVRNREFAGYDRAEQTDYDAVAEVASPRAGGESDVLEPGAASDTAVVDGDTVHADAVHAGAEYARADTSSYDDPVSEIDPAHTPELAALAVVANAVMNLDAFVMKE